MNDIETIDWVNGVLATWADGIPDWVAFGVLVIPVLLAGAAFFGLWLMLGRKSRDSEVENDDGDSEE